MRESHIRKGYGSFLLGLRGRQAADRSAEKMPRGAYSKRPVGDNRPERRPAIRSQWDKNKKIILATKSICGICGKPVDKTLRYPDPMSPTVDHIIPVAKRGDPIDLDNLQLAHWICNRMKSDKLLPADEPKKDKTAHILPQSCNWRTE